MRSDTPKPQATYEEFDLDNGLHVILEADRFAPVVAFQMWVKVGSSDERRDEAGLAHVLEHMLFKGTARRQVGEIARDVEGAGGDINAWTSHDETVYHLVMPSSEFDRGLDILADAVQNSALDPEELRRELEVIREEIRRGEDSPHRRLSDAMFDLSFVAHPYKYSVIGSDESVRSFTRDKVTAFYRNWYIPANMTLLVVGDFDPARERPRLESFFREFKSFATPAHRHETEPAQEAPRARVIVDDSKLAHLALTLHGPSAPEADVAALDALAVILGQGESARLVQRLERREALVNDVSAYLYSGRTAGLFMIESDMAPANLRSAAAAIGEELFAFARRRVDAAELEKAKTILENEAVFQMQTAQGRARRLGYGRVLVGDAAFTERYLEAVRRLEADDLLNAARAWFKAERVNAVLLWPKEAGDAPGESELVERLSGSLAESRRAAAPSFAPDAHGIVLHSLPNGVRLIVKPSHSAPVVSFQAATLAGVRAETEAENGVNNMIAQMLTLGTEERSAEDVAEATDAIGASLSGFSGRNTLGLKAAVVRRHFEAGFALFADCLLRPSFDAQELETEKAMVLEEIRARDENPGRLAFDLFHRTLYATHPYRFDVLGRAEAVAGFDQSALAAYYAKALRSQGLVVTVVGDVDVEHAVAVAERHFGSLENAPPVFAAPAAEAPLTAIRQNQIALDKQQTHIVMGFLGLTYADPDRHALAVLNSLLAGQGGRLFMELRDRQSLAYAVASYHLESMEPGYFAVYIGTAPEKRRTAEAGILAELRRVIDGPIDIAELAAAKRYLTGSHAIGLQTAGAQAGQMLLDELYGLGYVAYTRYIGLIEAVGLEDVRRVAARVLDFDAYALAVVGPEEK